MSVIYEENKTAMNKQQGWHIKVALIHVLVTQLTTEQHEDEEEDENTFSSAVLPEQISKLIHADEDKEEGTVNNIT
jgi:hypothetical protein